MICVVNKSKPKLKDKQLQQKNSSKRYKTGIEILAFQGLT